MEFLSNDVFITWNNKQNLNEINLNLRWFLSDLRTTDVGASQQYASQVSASEHFEGERLTVNINIRQNFGDGVLFKYIICLIEYLRGFVQRCV